MTDKKITAYKGFNEDWTCRGFQYKVGETYEHNGEVTACNSGFHACENPFDVWGYYDVTGSKFAVVSMGGETSKDGSDTKIASGKITIEAELTLSEFIKAGVNWILNKTKGKEDSGCSAQVGSSGDYARTGSSGHYARIGSSGYSARIGSSGYSAQIGSSGYSAQIGSSGDSAQVGSSGPYAQVGSSGPYAQIGSSGDYARIGSSGPYARIVAEGGNSVIASAGYNARVRGAVGTWISVAEFSGSKCVGFATGCIGKDGLKPGALYMAKGGKLVECDE